MWGAISKLFTKHEHLTHEVESATATNVDINKSTREERDMEAQDSYDTRQSKQRASVKWLLSKAFNNRVPENLREPFYRDHEDQEHLKPQIAGTLANAELYCLALANIYSDPNYHSLNHWSILQTLGRKGVPVEGPPDCALTETVLIQTNPLRITAHMAVIESIMVLYAKEVVTPDRVLAGVNRFSGSSPGNTISNHQTPPIDHEAGLILWVNHACSALKKKISVDVNSFNGADGDRPNTPDFPMIREFKDLCDGVALAALVSYYCPDSLPWTKIQVSYLPTVQESVHNLLLVTAFSLQFLPYPVFHMMPEDVTYMRGAMKQNLIVFLADLFNVLEIHPAKCVRFHGMAQPTEGNHPARNSQGVVHKRIMPPAAVAPIPDLRSGIDSPSHAFTTTVTRSPSASQVRRPHTASPALVVEPQVAPDETFPVHRGRAVLTLSSVHNDEPLVPAKLRQAKEKTNHESKAEERGDGKNAAAGRPSNWEDARRSSYAGRRSRRNSITDDSQLTIENFGGSQDHLNFIGRNPDKDLVVHVGRKLSNTQEPPSVAVRSSLQDARGSIQLSYDNPEGPFIGDAPGKEIGSHYRRQLSNTQVEPPVVAARSSVQDARGSIQLLYDSPESGSEKQDNEREKPFSGKLRRAQSIEGVSLKNILLAKDKDQPDGEVAKLASFADLKKSEPKGVNSVYMQENIENSKSSFANKKHNENGETSNGGGDKRTSFAKLPNKTTTWQQQSNLHNQNSDTSGDDSANPATLMASELNNIRLKLEEKRRHIESEKRRMEEVMSNQRQKVGKAAFLQAVTKGKGALVRTPPEPPETAGVPQRSPSAPNVPTCISKPQRPFSLKEISDDANLVGHKWLELDGSAPFVETRRTPDIESMDVDQYHHSIAQMNSSLHDIQADIQRLASQQNQIQATQQQTQLLAQQQQMAALVKQQQAQIASLHQNHDMMHSPHALINPMYKSQGNLHHTMSFGSQHNINMQPQMSYNSPLHQNYGSNPHINAYTQPLKILTSPRMNQDVGQFYLHEQPAPVQRRTWGQQSPQIQQPSAVDSRTYKSPAQTQGFMLHEAAPDRYQLQSTQQQIPIERYQNGDHSLNNHNNYSQQIYNPHSSPQHRNNSVHRQISQIIVDGESKVKSPITLQRLESADKSRSPNPIHVPLSSPHVDEMAPQSISFIGSEEDDLLSQGIGKLNITSGNRTYRIPSPTRPSLNRNSFHQPLDNPPTEVHSLEENDPQSEKGFYISFDNEPPKRPKPALRMKRNSPKKERGMSYIESSAEREDYLSEAKREKLNQLEYELKKERERQQQQSQEAAFARVQQAPLSSAMPSPSLRDVRERERDRQTDSAHAQERESEAIIIGNDLTNPDPDSVDEMERKKERIMLLSLQRRQQQEASKAKKEMEAMQKQERENQKNDEKARKKEEQAQRRAAILEQYKLKKAIEEAEREGKVLDKSDLMNVVKPVPKLRPKGTTTGRPRPKTIHVDSGTLEMAEGMLNPSRGKKGSSSNLTGLSQNSMRRDYYRGSQDSLADRTGGYRESPDDCTASSPGRTVNPTLGRRGSYKTSRDEPDKQTRGRPKYSTYQSNFKGRKSNSLMNLCDTDSGLGRATPPRRAPSPGMGPMRHLPSPSGPGSLPGGLMKRRTFDDGSSDISSTPSSMMDYNGPRLYKQPATKSNRGIMLNAVEYCVFPGVVNKEAKRRVLEEIARSESKHFLILFRDAGCQFRALYSYCPDGDEVMKLYGTGPKQVTERMFDKFFKYNSGGKCFSQVHTKHLTVTIDAFTIHNSLWQGKKVNLPSKKDMTLVI